MIMNNNSHPDKDSLYAFLENQDDTNVSLHLASCATCRQEVANLTSLSQQLLRYRRKHSSGVESVKTQDKLNNILHGDISQQQREAFKLELQNDKQLLREALHFASHSTAMKTSLGSDNVTNNNFNSENNNAQQAARSHTTNVDTSPSSSNSYPNNSPNKLLKTFAQRCKNYISWQPPLWSVATVTACLIISLTVNLQIMNAASTDLAIVAYQDNPVMTFTSQQDNTPGIGFFSNIHSSTQSFSNVQISQFDSDTLVMSWPNVHNANDYTLSLFQITSGDRLLVNEQKVKTNSATFSTTPLQLSNINSRFEWTLTGVTTDNKSFRALGGFIISNDQ